MSSLSIEEASERFGLPKDFVSHLYDIITDKSYLVRACKMFVNGTLKYSDATGENPIDIASIRHDIASGIIDIRKKERERFERERIKYEYYKQCKHIVMRHNNAADYVLIDDGNIVAFGFESSRGGGIYAANNIHESFNWNAHVHLSRIRKMNKAFYRRIKREAFNEHASLFDFNEKTIKNK